MEHAILHLLYARFVTKALHDMGYLDFVEPFTALINQGEVINQGKGMSKSLGNGVDLGEQIAKFGVDAVRLTMIFAGPRGRHRLGGLVTRRVAALPAASLAASGDVTSPVGVDPTGGDAALRRITHKTIHDATQLLGMHRFNVVVARVMEWSTAPARRWTPVLVPPTPRFARPPRRVAIILSLVAPFTAEEMWERLGHGPTVARAGWPTADPALLVQDRVTCVVQVQGKVRAKLEVSPSVSESELESLALADRNVQRAIGEGSVRKVIVKPPRIVNVVVG